MDQTLALIAILSIKGIGPITAKKLIPPPNIYSDKDLIAYLLERSASTRLQLTEHAVQLGIENAERVVAESKVHDIKFINYSSQLYPALLNSIAIPPLVLFYRGDISLISGKCVAIIGSRQASPRGMESAYNCSKLLVNAGYVVTSGLALGIDSAAHLACLDYGGKTIAVVGNGLDTVYPYENKLLASKILKCDGLILSECFIGEKANAGTLLRRNKVVVGLCKNVIIVETKGKGGTIHTVNNGRKEGRNIGCMTNKNESRIGNQALLMNPTVTALDSDKSILHFLNI